MLSTPISQLPPSRIKFILPFKSSMTCWAVVGDGLPDEFADGPAIGLSVAEIRNLAYFELGTRNPMVFWPGWTLSANTDFLGTGTRIVSGPGQ